MENSKEREKKEIHSISNELSFGHSDVSLLIQFIFHLLLLYSSRGVLICENWQTNRFVLSRLIFDLINQSIRKVMNCGMAERERERFVRFGNSFFFVQKKYHYPSETQMILSLVIEYTQVRCLPMRNGLQSVDAN